MNNTSQLDPQVTRWNFVLGRFSLGKIFQICQLKFPFCTEPYFREISVHAKGATRRATVKIVSQSRPSVKAFPSVWTDFFLSQVEKRLVCFVWKPIFYFIIFFH